MNRALILLAFATVLIALYNYEKIQNLLPGSTPQEEETEECIPSPIPSEDELYRFAHSKLNRSA